MRVEDDRVARSNHAHYVAGQCRQRVGDGRDGTDDAERCVLRHSEPVVAARRVALEKLDARHELDDVQLLNLVVEPADFCLFKFEPPQLVGLFVTNAVNAGDGLGPIGQRGIAKFLETVIRGRDCLVDGAENAPIAAARRAVAARPGGPSTQLGEHLLHDLPNGLFVGLNHGLFFFTRRRQGMILLTQRPEFARALKMVLEPTCIWSTMPITAASIGSCLVSGVKRALEPCTHSTTSPSPAPTVSTATNVRPVGDNSL